MWLIEGRILYIFKIFYYFFNAVLGGVVKCRLLSAIFFSIFFFKIHSPYKLFSYQAELASVIERVNIEY